MSQGGLGSLAGYAMSDSDEEREDMHKLTGNIQLLHIFSIFWVLWTILKLCQLLYSNSVILIRAEFKKKC